MYTEVGVMRKYSYEGVSKPYIFGTPFHLFSVRYENKTIVAAITFSSKRISTF